MELVHFLSEKKPINTTISNILGFKEKYVKNYFFKAFIYITTTEFLQPYFYIQYKINSCL